MRRSRVLLVWSLLVAGLLVAAVAMSVGRARLDTGRATSAGVASPGRAAHATDAVDVDGLSGEIEVAPGAHLRVRIARLHARAAQQRFDSASLARRFELGPGEPFVCELSSTGPGLVPQAALRSITVRDERGTALAPFGTPAPSPLEPADPLATLLSPPTEPLAAGHTVSLVLWGRTPEGEARLAGLPFGDVPVAPARMTSRELDTALARIDPDPADEGTAVEAPR